MFRWLAGLLLLVAIVFGLSIVRIGRGTPPILTIDKPHRVVGQAGALEVTVEAPNARLTELRIALEQNGRTTPLYELNKPEPLVIVTPVDRNHLKISRPLGRQSVPELRSGAAKIVVNAPRPSMLNLRTLSSSASKDIQVRLAAPRVGVRSAQR